MPGTISVSVLELADLPSTSANEGGRISFTVSLGKREYRTNGKGDFSFPVLSLRDDLVMTLHDAEGSEISRAVIKTMQVMENGFWDSWFPLEGGGNAHMTFQFLLSEDEQKRIYEKRESAIKRTYIDLISTGRRHSFSEDILRPSSPRPPVFGTELLKESHATEHLQQRTPVKYPYSTFKKLHDQASSSQLVSRLPQELQNHPAPDSDQAKTLNKLLPTNAYGSEKSMDEHAIASVTEEFKGAPTNACELQESMGRKVNSNISASRIQVPGDLVKSWDSTSVSSVENNGLVHKKQNDAVMHSASLVKKMIGAFESGFSQETTIQPYKKPVKTFRLRKSESLGSFEEAMSENGQLGIGKPYSDATSAAETLERSFSSGMQFKMNSGQSPEYLKTLPKKEFEDKIDSSSFNDEETSPLIKVKAVEYSSLLHATEDPLRTDISEEPQLMAHSHETEETCKLASSACQHEPSADVTYVEAIHKSCTDEPLELGEHSRSHNPLANRMQSSLDIAPLYGTCSNSQDIHVELAESPTSVISNGNGKSLVSLFYVEQEAINADRKDSAHASCRIESVASSADHISRENNSCLSTCQEQYLAANCATAKSSGSINDEFMEPFKWRGSRESLNIRTESCLVWYPSLWRRRPCITTGAGQLIDILEGYDIFLGTYPQKSLIDLNDMEEHKKRSGLVDEAFEDNNIARISKKSNSDCIFAIPKISKGLIEQGLSVMILVVACGTLILNAGAR